MGGWELSCTWVSFLYQPDLSYSRAQSILQDSYILYTGRVWEQRLREVRRAAEGHTAGISKKSQVRT